MEEPVSNVTELEFMVSNVLFLLMERLYPDLKMPVAAAEKVIVILSESVP